MTAVNHVRKNRFRSWGPLTRLEIFSAAMGLTGAYYLSSGDALLSQVFFAIANPILIILAFINGSLPTVILFTVYEYFAIVGVLRGLGVL